MNKSNFPKSFAISIAVFCLLAASTQSQAANKAKPAQAAKEKLVLMPLRAGEEIRDMLGAMQTALVQGLQQKYVVFSGEEVAQKSREIFDKQAGKKNCDETRCMEDIAIAFQSELIATASVTKIEGGYLLALSIRNVLDNKAIYSNSLPCKGCDAFAVIDKLKELSGAPTTAVDTSEAEEPPAKINQNDPESALWGEVQKGNSLDDYAAYLGSYPKGKYVALAKSRVKKLQEQGAAELAQQEQSAWDSASGAATEAGYQAYLSTYPKGRYAALAAARISKLQKEAAVAQQKRDATEAAARAPQPGKAFRDCPDCPEMVVIPKGSFDMGSSNGEADEKPVHRVTISKAYAIGKTEITRGQFAAFVNAAGYDAGNECYVYTDKWEKRSGANWRNPGYQQGDSHPVACINWHDATAYVEWLSRKTGKQYRLPTESQWEYACRAGGQHEYCGSDNVDSVAWYGRKGGDTTHPSAQKQANAFGLYDMSGNVWEWTADSYHDSYNGAPSDGAEWQGDGAKRVLRGGSWGNTPNDARSAYRSSGAPAIRDTNIGFRVSRTLP